MDINRYAYICPKTKEMLQVQVANKNGQEVINGVLASVGGVHYPIEDGIPDFTHPDELGDRSRAQREYYDHEAENYDDFAYLTFRIQNENEDSVRNKFIEALKLKPDAKVLDLACGTGQDSVKIASVLSSEGELQLIDISKKMLLKCRDKLAGSICQKSFAVGNATSLPFPNEYFDAILSFGGLNEFDDIKLSFVEMVRVSKPGGRIVVGDESMPPWLYGTEFADILLDNNKLFRNPVPLEFIPVQAREVYVRWIIGGVYYLIEFTVGEGPPTAEFDLEIPGRRGGTLRTRYYGNLEGVKPETKKVAMEAAKNAGKSMHEWLDEIIKKAVSNQ